MKSNPLAEQPVAKREADMATAKASASAVAARAVTRRSAAYFFGPCFLPFFGSFTV
jgi:hypothetical protein